MVKTILNNLKYNWEKLKTRIVATRRKTCNETFHRCAFWRIWERRNQTIFEYQIKVVGKKESYTTKLNGNEVEVPVWDYVIIE